MQDLDFNEIVDLIRKEDGRYHRRAYIFVREGLDKTVKALKQAEAAQSRQSMHITGRELSHGLKTHALDQYGPMAKMVLADWGIKKTDDFGEIVYNLIEYNVLSKTENDRKEHFDAVFDFDDAFVTPYTPTSRSASSRPSRTKSG